MSNSVLEARKRNLIFINLMITCIAGAMLSTALTTALPQMIADFNISVTTGQWLTSGYSLAMAIMMPMTAFLITRFPTKNLYCTAVCGFLIGLVVSALSNSFGVMMIGRVIQAGCNGITTSMAQVIILTIFPPNKRGTAMGWYGLSIGAAPVLAPTLAGALVDHVGWRMIFWIAIAIMVISFACSLFIFDNVLETAVSKFDFVSFLMSAFAFGGVTLGIGNISSYGLMHGMTGGALLIGVISGILFVYRQLHVERPFLDLRLLARKEYCVSVLGSMLLYFVMMGSSLLLPLYVQQVMQKSATISGLVSMPGSLTMAIVSPFAGKIYDKMGMRLLFIIGALGLIICNAGMVFITMDTSIWLVSVLNVFRSIAIGCLMMPLVTWGAAKIEVKRTSHATALLTSLRTISGAIGSAAFVGIMSAVSVSSAAVYGDNAAIHGINVAYLGMVAVSCILLLVAVVGCGKSSRENKDNKDRIR